MGAWLLTERCLFGGCLLLFSSKKTRCAKRSGWLWFVGLFVAYGDGLAVLLW